MMANQLSFKALRKLARSVRWVFRSLGFYYDFIRFKKLSNGSARFTTLWSDRYPCLNDRTPNTGFDRHYIFHPAWAARILAKTRPPKHIDISSSLHFCSLVSAFVPVEFYDYRPADLRLSGLLSKKGDLLSLPFADSSVASLSCMHVIEHVGLGRYGDPLDPDGDIKAIAELKRVLAKDGQLLFVVPIGKPRIQYNAHRIYSYEQVVSLFPDLTLKQFALIPDDPARGGLLEDADPRVADGQSYGCGCFWFVRDNALA